MPSLTVTAYGTPAPQGSKSLVRGRLIESSRRVRPWRDAVVAAVMEHPRRIVFCERVPVAVEIFFYLARPAGHYGTGRNASRLRGDAPPLPVGKQRDDLDKLCRAVLDALTEARVLDDDSQVTELAAAKLYADGVEPGAVISVRSLND